MSEILLVRHGQASFHSDDYDQLSELGWQQSRILGEHLDALGAEFGAVYTGTLRRHRETLTGMRHHLNLPDEVIEIEGLNEFDFASLVADYLALHPDEAFDRHDPAAFYRCLRKAALAWSRDELPKPYMRWTEFEAGLRAALAQISDHPGERALVVSSGGPISALVREILDLDVAAMINLNLQAANTGMTRLVGKGRTRYLGGFNSIAHLEHPERAQLQTWH